MGASGGKGFLSFGIGTSQLNWRSETRGKLETYTHCMEHGLVVEKGIGPNYPGSGKNVSRFSRPNDQAKKIVKFWHFGTLDKCATEADILDSSTLRTIRSYYSHRPYDFNSRVSAFSTPMTVPSFGQ